jgi:hypothetical protein
VIIEPNAVANVGAVMVHAQGACERSDNAANGGGGGGDGDGDGGGGGGKSCKQLAPT